MISVIMSVFNETEYQLEKSISSILNQTYKDIELIIINDNPKEDRIVKYLSSINDDRVKVYSNDVNRGLVYSLNKAIYIAKGEYIARMDADDISDPNRLSKQLYLIENKQLDLVGGQIKLIDESDNIFGEIRFPTEDFTIKKQLAQKGTRIPHPTWLGKKEVFLKLKYREIKFCEDYDFLLRASHMGIKMGNVHDFILMYRVRSSGISAMNKAEQLITRRYLSSIRDRISTVNIRTISDYLISDIYQKKIQNYEKYENYKKSFRNGHILKGIAMLFNTNFYLYLWEKFL